MKYVKLKDKSKEWGLTDRGLRNLCEKGKIEGARKENNTWLIPKLALKPLNLKKGELLKIFRQEKKMKLHGGLYHKTQIDLAYNSNHIEGNRLSHEQTRYIFETKSVLSEAQDVIHVDDIIETQNHFSCFDYVIDNANRTLTEKYVKKLHYLLKNGTTDSSVEWFNVGEYKKYANEIAGKTTTLPKNVKRDMQKLFSEYNSKKEITILDIIDFHYKFEIIHPFQDGNGRVGRLIMFKECLKHDIIPFIITDENKALYYNGLKNYEHEKGYLIGVCKLMQDDFTDIIRYFLEE